MHQGPESRLEQLAGKTCLQFQEQAKLSTADFKAPEISTAGKMVAGNRSCQPGVADLFCSPLLTHQIAVPSGLLVQSWIHHSIHGNTAAVQDLSDRTVLKLKHRSCKA